MTKAIQSGDISSHITLTSMGPGVGGQPPTITHYAGSIIDASTVYKGLGPPRILVPGQGRQFAVARLHVNGDEIARKLVPATNY